MFKPTASATQTRLQVYQQQGSIKQNAIAVIKCKVNEIMYYVR